MNAERNILIPFPDQKWSFFTLYHSAYLQIEKLNLKRMNEIQKESREIENMKGFVFGAPAQACVRLSADGVAFSLIMSGNSKTTEATATAE